MMTSQRIVTGRFLVLSAVLIAILAFAGLFTVSAQEGGLEDVAAHAALVDAAGNPVGTVRFIDEQEYGTVAVIVQAQGLQPGFHGLHLHQTGQCDPAASPPFSSAGGHWDLEGDNHPNHTGDFPVLPVMTNGTAAMSFRTDRFTVQGMFDEDGTAVLIHSLPDNYANIPQEYLGEGEGLLESTLSGDDPGDPVACGVVTQGDVVPQEEGAAPPATEEPGMTGGDAGAVTAEPGAGAMPEEGMQVTAEADMGAAEPAGPEIGITAEAGAGEMEGGDAAATAEPGM